MRDKNYAIVFYHYDKYNNFRYGVISCEYSFMYQLYSAYYKYMIVSIDRMVSIIDADELKYLEDKEMTYVNSSYYFEETQNAIKGYNVAEWIKELNKIRERSCKI